VSDWPRSGSLYAWLAVERFDSLYVLPATCWIVGGAHAGIVTKIVSLSYRTGTLLAGCEWEKIPKRSRFAVAAQYVCMVRGGCMPRQLLSLVRQNLLEDPSHCRTNF